MTIWIEWLDRSDILMRRNFQKTKTNEAKQFPLNDNLALIFKQIKAEYNPRVNVIAIDGKSANMLQLKINHVFRLEGKMINGVKS